MRRYQYTITLLGDGMSDEEAFYNAVENSQIERLTLDQVQSELLEITCDECGENIERAFLFGYSEFCSWACVAQWRKHEQQVE